MKIYCSKRYRFWEDILDTICGKDLWLLINYNIGLNGVYHPQQYWIQVVEKYEHTYRVKMINDYCYGYDIAMLENREIQDLNMFKVLDIYDPLELLSSQELAEEKELDE